jgi:hypothetical protein
MKLKFTKTYTHYFHTKFTLDEIKERLDKKIIFDENFEFYYEKPPTDKQYVGKFIEPNQYILRYFGEYSIRSIYNNHIITITIEEDGSVSRVKILISGIVNFFYPIFLIILSFELTILIMVIALKNSIN